MLGSLLMKRATEIICPGDANQADQRRPGLLGRPYTKAVYGAMRRGAAFPLVISLPVRLPSGDLRSEERRVGKSVSVRVDLGGRRILKKKKLSIRTDDPDTTLIRTYS